MRARMETPGKDDSSVGGIHGVAYLSGMDDRAAVVEIHWNENRRNRHQESARHPERGSLRPGKSEGTHPGLPGGEETATGNEGTDSVLRRTSGRGQNIAWKIDCSRDGPQVCAAGAGRHAR